MLKRTNDFRVIVFLIVFAPFIFVFEGIPVFFCECVNRLTESMHEDTLPFRIVLTLAMLGIAFFVLRIAYVFIRIV